MTESTYPIKPEEAEFSAIRAQGAGGQNVNKVSNAVHLRYDLRRCSLPEEVKARLLAHADQRISEDGVVVIKAQRSRSLVQNRADALVRLQALVDRFSQAPNPRKATRPTRGSQQRRLQSKAERGALKEQRGRVSEA